MDKNLQSEINFPEKISETAKNELKELISHIEKTKESSLESPERSGVLLKSAAEKYESLSEKKTLLESEIASRAENIKNIEEKKKLQELINFAFKEGPIFASKVAFKIGDATLEDKLHDTLVEFHKELVKRGKLEEF